MHLHIYKYIYIILIYAPHGIYHIHPSIVANATRFHLREGPLCWVQARSLPWEDPTWAWRPAQRWPPVQGPGRRSGWHVILWLQYAYSTDINN